MNPKHILWLDMPVNKPEVISFYSHAAGIIAAICGMVCLQFIATEFILKVLSVIYSFSVIALFAASTLYHGLKKDENENSLWRKLDHIAIFIMIAGTYTPISYIYLPHKTALCIITIQWSLVAMGVVFKIYFLHAPRWLYTAIYVMMGWMAVFFIKDITNAMDVISLGYLISGGVAFTIGALFYIAKWPQKNKGYVGFHEIFHFFILLGAFLHYAMIYRGMHIYPSFATF